MCARCVSCQPLVADLRGCGEEYVPDPLGRQLRVAPEHLTDDLDRHVVGSRPPEHPLWARPAERGTDTVDVEDLHRIESTEGVGYGSDHL